MFRTSDRPQVLAASANSTLSRNRPPCGPCPAPLTPDRKTITAMRMVVSARRSRMRIVGLALDLATQNLCRAGWATVTSARAATNWVNYFTRLRM
jgi:hypothetical protein